MIKLINFLIIQIQRRIFKNFRVVGMPYELIIDPSNICNLHCQLCPVGLNKEGRDRRNLDFQDFKLILDELGEYLINLHLYNWGEPFLNKDIFKMIEYAKKFRIKVIISSNLNYYDDNFGRQMVESGLDKLIVSLDGADREAVSGYQNGNDYNKVINNMKNLVLLKEELKSKKPFIQWRFLVTRYNEAQIKEAREIAKSIGINCFELAKIRCEMGDEVLKNSLQQYESVCVFLPVNQYYSLYNYKTGQKKKIKKECSFLWSRTVINSDLGVSPCCAIFSSKFDFGNLRENSFKEIWNNSMYQKARKIIALAGDFSDDIICNVCKKNNAII